MKSVATEGGGCPFITKWQGTKGKSTRAPDRGAVPARHQDWEWARGNKRGGDDR